MKRFFLFISLLIIGSIASSLLAQEKSFLNRITLEAGGGYNIPVSPDRDDISTSNFTGLRGFYLATNYELSNTTGLRFTYANNSFQDKNDSSMGLTHHKFMAEGTFNIIQWIEMVQNPFEIIAHAGAGISLGKSKLTSDIDKMGTLQVGLMPLFRITNKISIHADAAYVINLRQNYFYDGRQATLDGSQTEGEYFMFNIGVGVRFWVNSKQETWDKELEQINW